MLGTVDAPASRLGALTPKERECLRLVARQHSSKEIARELGISKASVDTYCNRARAKLGVTNRRAAAQLVVALEGGGARPAEAEPTVSAVAPVVAAVSVLPPLSSLGTGARLGLIVAGAVALALAFGMLLSGLQTLNDVAQTVRQKQAVASAFHPG
jgi:DNA-binding CsgD family transcriptional regulator